MSARPGPYGGYHAEWYPYRDQRLQEARPLNSSIGVESSGGGFSASTAIPSTQPVQKQPPALALRTRIAKTAQNRTKTDFRRFALPAAEEFEIRTKSDKNPSFQSVRCPNRPKTGRTLAVSLHSSNRSLIDGFPLSMAIPSTRPVRNPLRLYGPGGMAVWLVARARFVEPCGHDVRFRSANRAARHRQERLLVTGRFIDSYPNPPCKPHRNPLQLLGFQPQSS